MIQNSSDSHYKKRASKLTAKEIAIIKLICEQHTNKEIADKLDLSKRTVEGYREQILKKIKAKSTVGLVIYAIKHNIYKVKLAR